MAREGPRHFSEVLKASALPLCGRVPSVGVLFRSCWEVLSMSSLLPVERERTLACRMSKDEGLSKGHQVWPTSCSLWVAACEWQLAVTTVNAFSNCCVLLFLLLLIFFPVFMFWHACRVTACMCRDYSAWIALNCFRFLVTVCQWGAHPSWLLEDLSACIMFVALRITHVCCSEIRSLILAYWLFFTHRFTLFPVLPFARQLCHM